MRKRSICCCSKNVYSIYVFYIFISFFQKFQSLQIESNRHYLFKKQDIYLRFKIIIVLKWAILARMAFDDFVGKLDSNNFHVIFVRTLLILYLEKKNFLISPHVYFDIVQGDSRSFFLVVFIKMGKGKQI